MGGRGAPEFIISTGSAPDFLIIVECKASGKHHESSNHAHPADFAVDGALHYAKILAKSFNIIAVAVSGQTANSLKVSCFLFPREARSAQVLTNRDTTPIEKLIPIDDFIEHASYDPEVTKNRTGDLMAFSRELHDFMRDHAKLTESEKPLLVSGTLIALRNKVFANGFSDYTPEKLQRHWLEMITEEFDDADLPQAKKLTMSQPYSTIAVHPELGKPTKAFPKGVLHELISRLHRKVWPFISVYHDFDVVGRFYGEFLKYTGGDKKALGIVLTPRHIAELFSLIANLKKDSKVLDLCCGTGGFLISAMVRMMRLAVTTKEKKAIKKRGLIGVEQQPNMFALAASNMILRGDGKANLYQGSCFDNAIRKELRRHRCNVGMINPPYAQKDEESRELVFVKALLDNLVEGGTGIAILPMSCAISPSGHREQLLRDHTLEAVMSMPDDLFYPVGTITCIMVFTAHVPHAVTHRKTWFGYWKEDGFSKTKHQGRIDLDGKWASIRDSWVESFHNRDDVPGLSVKRYVTAADEWCAEAYMETNYSTLTQTDFARVARNFAVFEMLRASELADEISEVTLPPVTKWKKFKLSDLFELRKGRRITKAKLRPGTVPFITAIDSNNGRREFFSGPALFDGNTITVNYNGNGVAEAFYQPEPYWASDDVNVLYPRFGLNAPRAMFINTVIRRERYRFSYGRKWHLERMNESYIKLPVKSDGKPDWEMMEAYVRSFAFTAQVT